MVRNAGFKLNKFNKSGMAVISFDLSATFCCARTNLAPVAKALTICIAEVPFCISTLPRRVFPSIAIISFKAVCSDLTHVTKHDLNSSGFNTAKTRAKVSFEAIPFSKG